MKNISCEWMGLNLNSPFILASISLMSNISVDKQVNYFQNIVKMGAGAIILPSVNPARGNSKENDLFNKMLLDSIPLKTGIEKNDAMAFTVFGPTYSNLITLNYGVNLAKKTKNSVSIPVIGSVANIGRREEILRAVDALSCIAIDGIELNFSCPNVISEGNGSNLNLEILQEIRRKTKLPISLKLPPDSTEYSIFKEITDEINSVTVSNAYLGIVPPEINDLKGPFYKINDKWAPSGIYGPFERYLTYYRLYKMNKIAVTKKLDLACVGGIVEPENGIEAIMLGASVVQLSSAVAWKRINIFKSFNEKLKNYNIFPNVNEMKGQALKHILNSADSAFSYKNVQIKSKLIANIDETKCAGCGNCCDRMCLALELKINANGIKKAHVNKDLCSGCRWCYNFCHRNAINYI